MKIVYIIEKFPSPTEYFILNEILELQRRGIELDIIVLRKQKQFFDIPALKELKCSLFYLPKIYLYLPFLIFFNEPIAFIKSLALLFNDIRKQSLKTFRDYCISIYFASKLEKNQKFHFHAHFAFLAVDIASLLSKINKTKYSLTMHAQDIYTNEEKLRRVISDCSFLITCTEYNKKYLNEITFHEFENKIHRIYHGIDTSNWICKKTKPLENSPTKILCIARLVEKKGLVYLLEAMHKLINEGLNIQCTIIGEGTLKEELANYIEDNNLEKYIVLLDFQPQDIVKYILLKSDIFVLPSIIAENGDRDGLPNVIVEAMTLGIPVISTGISAIPEMIENRHTGLLVKDKDANAIVSAVKELISDENLYSSIVENAKRKIKSELEIQHCTDHLINVYENNMQVY